MWHARPIAANDKVYKTLTIDLFQSSESRAYSRSKKWFPTLRVGRTDTSDQHVDPIYILITSTKHRRIYKQESRNTTRQGDPTSHIIIHHPCAQPWIRIIMLVKVPHRPSSSEARNRCIRPTERDVVLLVKKVSRVPWKVGGREQSLVVGQEGRSPFPDAAVGTFAVLFVETCRGAIF